MTKITIGIITCGRPSAIKNCIKSVEENVHQPYELIVVDSLITKESSLYYSELKNIKLFAFDKPIGPAEGRKIIADNASSDHILFLDDDLELVPGTLEEMISHLENNHETSIATGCWLEHGGYRILGQYIIEDNGFVYKEFISRKKALASNLKYQKVDIGQASMLVKKQVFEKINFDPQFNFYFDLFDFFMQCKQENIVIHALADAIFLHHPGRYKGIKTLRQTSSKADDKSRFEKKWKLEVKGQTGARLEFDTLLKKYQYKVKGLFNL